MQEYLHQELTSRIITAFYKVYNTLGFGFLEKVYENSMLLELSSSGLFVERQKPIKVNYNEIVVGEYFADLIIENKVIVELKAAEVLIEEHELQLINYLKATEIEVGLLLNFGKNLKYVEKFLQIISENLFNLCYQCSITPQIL